jgi:general stress protein YciG
MAIADRGFASMDRTAQRHIASLGGRAAHRKGTAHQWDSREAAEAGRKGGRTTQRNKKARAR